MGVGMVKRNLLKMLIVSKVDRYYAGKYTQDSVWFITKIFLEGKSLKEEPYRREKTYELVMKEWNEIKPIIKEYYDDFKEISETCITYR